MGEVDDRYIRKDGWVLDTKYTRYEKRNGDDIGI